MGRKMPCQVYKACFGDQNEYMSAVPVSYLMQMRIAMHVTVDLHVFFLYVEYNFTNKSLVVFECFSNLLKSL